MLQVLIAIDQLINALCGGWADETISARAFRNQAKRVRWRMVMHLINALFFWQSRHCMQAYISEQQRRQLPPAYRERNAADAE